jgi:RNA polymerase sigma-54 factor
MKVSLQVRLSQHLGLTPQLQQSIRLLQLSTLELHQEIEHMLEANPFLERDEEDAEEVKAAQEVPDTEEAQKIETLEEKEFHPSERAEIDWDNGTESEDFEGIRETPPSSQAPDEGEDDAFSAERRAPALSLTDFLREQLHGMRLSAQDAAAVEALIESIDGDGYLDGDFDDIARQIADGLGLDESNDAALRESLIDQLRCGLRWLQSMEPTGVGARNLSECLCLQLRALPPGESKELALTLCERHLELLARRDFKKILNATGASEEALKAAQALILRCEPKPGRPFSRAEANIIIPDVIVQKAGREWRVILNPDVMPKLRIHDLYAQVLKNQRGTQGSASLSTHLQEARWFMKNIRQRFDTILRVSQTIVERQKSFFVHGAIAMKPLVLREIADELGLHESTISRVTTAKYMATPYGTFELKYFFGSSLNTEAGGNASSTAVRALLKQWISAEDPKAPLSDSQLSQRLESQGIQVARRTVAKYRELLKIAPVDLRRSL